MSDIKDVVLNELDYMRVMGQDICENMGRCNHCGNFTVHLTLMIYNFDNPEIDNLDYLLDEKDIEDLEETEDQTDELKTWQTRTDELKTWLIQKCVTCKGLLLKEKRIVKDDEYPYNWEEFKILYPATKTSSDRLPRAIMKKYKAALKIKPIDPASFAVLAGKTLEAACNHEKAKGRNLAQKLDVLAKSGRIPTPLAQMGQQVRLLRNLAAHDAEDEVTEEDVPIILEFLEAILEYLYVAPAKIEAVQARLTKNSEDNR